MVTDMDDPRVRAIIEHAAMVLGIPIERMTSMVADATEDFRPVVTAETVGQFIEALQCTCKIDPGVVADPLEPVNRNQLNLYVVGEASGDPARWSEYPGFRQIVIAASAAEALAFADLPPSCEAIPVDMSKAAVIAYESYSGG